MIRRKNAAKVQALSAALVVALAAVTVPDATAQGASASEPEVFASQQAPSQTEQGGGEARGWSFGARGVLSLLRDDSLDTGFGVTGFTVYPLTTDLEFEAEIGVQFMNTTADGVPDGSLMVVPIRGTIRVQLWRFGRAKPYAGGGAGVYLNRFSLDSGVEQALAQQGFNAEASVDMGLGLHLGGGIEWESGGWNFGADIKYVIGEADTQSAIFDTVTNQIFRGSGTLEFDGLWLAFGVRFHL